jgi:tetratricopeptide (TPR) repeat protein
VKLNLRLAEVLESEGRLSEAHDRLRFAAGLTNWNRETMAGVVKYYVDQIHDTAAAIAFLEARTAIEPQASEMIYSLAALHASIGQKDEALRYLQQAIVAGGGTNAIVSAKIDPRFESLQNDPRFRALLAPPTNGALINAAVNSFPVNPKPPPPAAKKR